jgi:hypothetical protein
MSKKKHKRKHQKFKNNTEARVKNVEGQYQEVVAAEKKDKSAHTTEPERNNKKEGSVRLRELAERSSLTDYIIALFTVILAVAAIYQFIITNSQLRVMRNDERAWLKFDLQPDKTDSSEVTMKLTAGQPIFFPIRVTNIGKTPARNINMKIFIEVVPATQEPSLNRVDDLSHHYPAGELIAGIVYPTTDFKQLVMRPGDSLGSAELATPEEVTSVLSGKSYLAAYGIIAYDDVFEIRHWTKFCTWNGTNGAFAAQQCTEYNNVDRN